jgi:hypothetical protein
MTDIEMQLFPKVGEGCKNLMPLLVYLYNNYSQKNVIECLMYWVNNKITGIRLLHVLLSDFNSDFDRMIKHPLKKP